MGIGGCCSCNNLKKSLYFVDENQNKNNNNNLIETNKTIEENIIIEEKNVSSNFNNNGSQIVNTTSFKQSDLKFDNQQQELEDDFENMFNKLSNNTESNI